MRKLSLALGLVAALGLSSCTAGPHQLKRTVDDWDQKMYVNSPWVDGVLWFVPVFPICHGLAWFVDSLTTDPYAFWFKDAWDGKGTGFKHFDVKAEDGSMKSLLLDDGKWFEIAK